MIIESIIKRAEGTIVMLGDMVYHFVEEVTGGPHVCDVPDDETDHIQTLLAIKEGYRLVKPAKAAANKKAQANNDAAEKAAADAAEKAAADAAAAAKPAPAKTA